MFLLVNEEGKTGFETAKKLLMKGETAMNAVEFGIREVEADPQIHSVGRSGYTDLLGRVGCDASIMDGRTLQTGAVAGLEGYLHAISVARKVMERLPHVFLMGEGATRFAREVGAEPAELLTEFNRNAHQAWLKQYVPENTLSKWPNVPLAEHAWTSSRTILSGGTTVFLAMDQQGNLAGGTSTSGWAHRYPGRVGDTAVIGAGLYADNLYGGCGCTHIGEMTIRVCTSRSVVLYMKKGANVVEACHDALRDLDHLKGGFLGPVMMHAVDRDGTPYVVSSAKVGVKTYCYWKSDTKDDKTVFPIVTR